MKKNVTLGENDFSPGGLKDFLNSKFSSKVSGKPFTSADVYSYTMRGKIPSEYGGDTIEVVNEENGLKVLRLKKQE